MYRLYLSIPNANHTSGSNSASTIVNQTLDSESEDESPTSITAPFDDYVEEKLVEMDEGTPLFSWLGDADVVEDKVVAKMKLVYIGGLGMRF